MRNKLALIIALAGFAVVTALGVGLAGAEPGDHELGRQPPGDGSPPRPARPRRRAAGLRQRSRRRRRRPRRPRRPRLRSRPDGDQRGSPPPARRRPKPTAPQRRSSGRRTEPSRAGADLDGRSNAGDEPTARRSPQPEPRRPTGGGSGGSGGVTAPPATAGVQPQAKAPTAARSPRPGGTPTIANPTTTIAPFGPAPIGVPNFVIDSFEIPPFLLPIYQACGTEYGIPWEVLASINKIETAFGTNLNVSSAGAIGWMQFLPSSWETYGVDANGDGRKDPYNPVDAICAAAHYLKAAGGDERPLQRDLRLQPRRLVRRRRCCSTRAPTASCPPTWSAR